MVIMRKTQDISRDVEIIQSSLAYEHAGIAAYRIAGGSGLLAQDTLKVALLFKSHHEGHRDELAKLLADIGASPVVAKTDDEYIAELGLTALKSEADILALAAKLEHGAANGYISQISGIQDRGLSRIFAQISADEMMHWTTLNGAIGGALPSVPFEFG